METLRPVQASEVRDIIAWAAAGQTPLAICGRGSKAALGYAVEAEHLLDLTGLNGVVAYEPSELYLTAKPGTPIAEIEALLAENNQMLAFEPSDFHGLLGSVAVGASLGGAISCNAGGPRRLTAGAARDHFLGFTAVNGRGEAYKAGAKVVKNVTGYDLSKLMAGAMGTLSVLTEITVKVLPRPETTCSMAVAGLDAAAALGLIARILNGPNEVTAAAFLPAEITQHIPVAGVCDAGAGLMVLRFEGPEPSVRFRRDVVDAVLAEAGGRERLHFGHEDSIALWRDIGSATGFGRAAEAATAVWRVCTTPSAAPEVAALAAAVAPCVAQYDWGGGLLYLASFAQDGAATAIRGAVQRHGGHATLLRAPAAMLDDVPLFQPASPGLWEITRRVKESFDPLRILNPGRMSRRPLL